PLTYQRDNEDPSSLPLLYPDMIEEDSPSINVVECQNDDSILTYLGADDSYLQRALPSETQTMLNESTIEINIHTEEDPHIVKIRQSLNTSEQAAFTTFLRARNQPFAWSYADMPGIDPTIAVHNITLNPDSKPVKQKLRKMHPRIALLVKEELQRLLSVSFILPIDYPQWISNIVPVMKATGGLQICTDFWDLNLTCPKDDFPLPSIDQLVDLTAGHEMLSLMDGFSGYNQILVAPADQHKTTFITPWGTFCYRVMPFGLKNAGATYQRAMTYIFHDIMHTILEDYVDDLLGKSKHRSEHLDVLTIIFDRLLQYSVRLQPKKCAFGVLSGKLLGFIISLRGIEVDPSK
ncbi:hypothetical protein KI387_022123, partial [Taxus chinensis]